MLSMSYVRILKLTRIFISKLKFSNRWTNIFSRLQNFAHPPLTFIKVLLVRLNVEIISLKLS